MMTAMGNNRHTDIVADSAEPKSIEEIYRAGYNIRPCVKGADSVRAGINLMKAKNLHVTPRSVNLQREMSSYAWKQDKNERWLPDPVDAFNHAIDAARYFVQSRLNRAKAGNLTGLGI
jgi:phage terminase large subunit